MEYDLNNYPNDYPNGVNNSEQQKQPKRGGGFLGGFLWITGMSSGGQLYLCCRTVSWFMEMTREKEVTQQTEGEEELVSDRTMAKLQVIEETISEYYYEEDVEGRI